MKKEEKKNIEEVYYEWNKQNDLLKDLLRDEFSKCAEELKNLNALGENILEFNVNNIVETDDSKYVMIDGEKIPWSEYICDNGIYYINEDGIVCIGLDFALDEKGRIYFTYSCVFDGGDGEDCYPEPDDFDDYPDYYNFEMNQAGDIYNLLCSVKDKIEKLKEK